MELVKNILVPTNDIVSRFRQSIFRMNHVDVNVEFCLLEAVDIASRTEENHFIQYSINRFLDDHRQKRVDDGVPYQYPEDHEIFGNAFSELVNSLNTRFRQLGIFHQGNVPQQFDKLLNDDMVIKLLGT